MRREECVAPKQLLGCPVPHPCKTWPTLPAARLIAQTAGLRRLHRAIAPDGGFGLRTGAFRQLGRLGFQRLGPLVAAHAPSAEILGNALSAVARTAGAAGIPRTPGLVPPMGVGRQPLRQPTTHVLTGPIPARTFRGLASGAPEGIGPKRPDLQPLPRQRPPALVLDPGPFQRQPADFDLRILEATFRAARVWGAARLGPGQGPVDEVAAEPLQRLPVWLARVPQRFAEAGGIGQLLQAQERLGGSCSWSRSALAKETPPVVKQWSNGVPSTKGA